MKLDEAGQERLLTGRVVWTAVVGDTSGEPPEGWVTRFEDHLCELQSIGGSGDGGLVLMLSIDGEPMGELHEWPPNWQVGQGSDGLA